MSGNHMGEMRSSYEVIGRASEGVSVAHDVVLEVPNSATSDNIYNEDFQKVDEAVNKLVNCPTPGGPDCPFEVSTKPDVEKAEVDKETVCDRSSEDPDLADFYEAVSINGVLICVTACDSSHTGYKKCYNKGDCRVFKQTGPLCECKSVDATWYLGNDCRLPIEKTPFYAGLSVTLICLLVAVAGLTAYTLLNKRKQTQRKDQKKKIVNEWMDDDFEWPRPSSTNTYGAGPYNNPSFTYGASARATPAYRQHSPSANIHSPSRVGNGYNNPFYGSLPSYQSNSPTNLPMSVRRPQTRTSWDA